MLIIRMSGRSAIRSKHKVEKCQPNASTITGSARWSLRSRRLSVDAWSITRMGRTPASPIKRREYRNPHISQVRYEAQRVLRKADRAIFVGYSLPDDDVAETADNLLDSAIDTAYTTSKSGAGY